MLTTQEQLQKINNIKQDIKFLSDNCGDKIPVYILETARDNMNDARDAINGTKRLVQADKASPGKD